MTGPLEVWEDYFLLKYDLIDSEKLISWVFLPGFVVRLNSVFNLDISISFSAENSCKYLYEENQ